MTEKPAKRSKNTTAITSSDYDAMLTGMMDLLEQARHASARAVNALMTATYWEIGRRIVEFEQGGARRAAYGKELLKRLALDLGTRFGQGFSERSLERYRAFYLRWPISTTLLTQSETSPDLSDTAMLAEEIARTRRMLEARK